VLMMRKDKRDNGLVFGLCILLLLLAIFFTFHYGIIPMYYRGLMYMLLMMSIVAGAGLMAMKNLKLPAALTARLKMPSVMHNAGYILCLILIGATLAVAIPDRQAIPYYHMIDEKDYQAFSWIKENVGGDYNMAILDPWKGSSFTAISGKNVYTWIGEQAGPTDIAAYAFLRNNSTDTSFLRENGISIIYTRVYDGNQGVNAEYGVNNPDLVEVAKDIYLLKKDNTANTTNTTNSK
jgi:hypothetical protein